MIKLHHEYEIKNPAYLVSYNDGKENVVDSIFISKVEAYQYIQEQYKVNPRGKYLYCTSTLPLINSFTK